MEGRHEPNHPEETITCKKLIDRKKRIDKSHHRHPALRARALLFDLFYDHLIESGVREEQIIPIALDDDMFTKYRDPDELSRFIRSKKSSQKKCIISSSTRCSMPLQRMS